MFLIEQSLAFNNDDDDDKNGENVIMMRMMMKMMMAIFDDFLMTPIQLNAMWHGAPGDQTSGSAPL